MELANKLGQTRRSVTKDYILDIWEYNKNTSRPLSSDEIFNKKTGVLDLYYHLLIFCEFNIMEIYNLKQI